MYTLYITQLGVIDFFLKPFFLNLVIKESIENIVKSLIVYYDVDILNIGFVKDLIVIYYF